MLFEVFVKSIEAGPSKKLPQGVLVAVARGEMSAIPLPQLADRSGHSALKFGISLVCDI